MNTNMLQNSCFLFFLSFPINSPRTPQIWLLGLEPRDLKCWTVYGVMLSAVGLKFIFDPSLRMSVPPAGRSLTGRVPDLCHAGPSPSFSVLGWRHHHHLVPDFLSPGVASRLECWHSAGKQTLLCTLVCTLVCTQRRSDLDIIGYTERQTSDKS